MCEDCNNQDSALGPNIKSIVSVETDPITGIIKIIFSDGSYVNIPPGAKGWSPIIVPEITSTDTELQFRWKIVSWVGGSGVPPSVDPVNNYLGNLGLTNFTGANVGILPIEKFVIDSQGSNKSIYDSEQLGYTFYDNSVGNPDSGKVFFKLSDAIGDWSVGYQWRGPGGTSNYSAGQNINISPSNQISVKYHIEPVLTLAALALLNTSAILNNAVIFVEGEGFYYLDSNSAATINGSTVIAAQAGGRWIKIISSAGSGSLNVLLNGTQINTVPVSSVNFQTGVGVTESTPGSINLTNINTDYKGHYVTLSNLQVAFPTAQDGNSATVTDPVDIDKVLIYHWINGAWQLFSSGSGGGGGGFTEVTAQDTVDVLNVAGIPQASLDSTRGYTPNRLREFLIGLFNRANTWLQQQIFTLGINIGNLGASALRRNLSVEPNGDVVATPELSVESTVTAPLLLSNNINKVQYGRNFIHTSPASETSLINLPDFSGSSFELIQTDSSGNLQRHTYALSNVAFVSTNGSDNFGQVGKWHKPYLTIEQAFSAIGNDGLVYVLPGFYVTTLAISLGTTNKSLYLSGRTTISLTQSISATLPAISNFGATTGSRIFGDGHIRVNTQSISGFRTISCDQIYFTLSVSSGITNFEILNVNRVSGESLTASSCITSGKTVKIGQVQLSLSGVLNSSNFISSVDTVQIDIFSYTTVTAYSYSPNNSLLRFIKNLKIGTVTTGVGAGGIEKDLFETCTSVKISSFELMGAVQNCYTGLSNGYSQDIDLGGGSELLRVSVDGSTVQKVLTIKASRLHSLRSTSVLVGANTDVYVDVRKIENSCGFVQSMGNLTFKDTFINGQLTVPTEFNLIFIGTNRIKVNTPASQSALVLTTPVNIYNYGNIYTNSNSGDGFGGILTTSDNKTPGWYLDTAGIPTLETNGLPSRGMYNNQTLI